MAYAEKLKTNNWRGVWRDEFGSRRSKSGFTGKRAAAEYATRQEMRVRSGPEAKRTAMTYGDWLEVWWADYQMTLSVKSVDAFEHVMKRLDPLRPVELQKVDKVMAQRWVSDLLAEGLAPETVRSYTRFMKRSFAAAVDYGYLASNPTESVRQPPKREGRRLFIPHDEIPEVCERIDEFWQPLFLVLAVCGLRWGEAIALRSSDVSSALDISKTAGRLSDGTLVEGPPKTAAGNRIVPMPSFVADAVHLHMARHRDRLVFRSVRDRPYPRSQDFKKRVLGPATAGRPYESMRVHDLRHTALSMWAANGLPPSEMAAMAGHSSPNISLAIYTHVTRKTGEDFMHQLNW